MCVCVCVCVVLCVRESARNDTEKREEHSAGTRVQLNEPHALKSDRPAHSQKSKVSALIYSLVTLLSKNKISKVSVLIHLLYSDFAFANL